MEELYKAPKKFRGYRKSNREAVRGHQPRVGASRDYPGIVSCKTTQPQRGCPICFVSVPNVAAKRQRWALFRNRFAVSILQLVAWSFCSLSLFTCSAGVTLAQNPPPNTDTLKKANTRPGDTKPQPAEPFDGAGVEKMKGQCVTLDTENGAIVIEMLPAVAPESARSFLNLAATGGLDTTTFSRVVKGFVIQGGNLSTNENWGPELAARMSRRLPDEPSDVRHVRGIVSMARRDEPNSATTHFFILVGDGPHLDGTFTAFGRVVTGLEVADAINRAPVEDEKPMSPVRIKHARVAPCQK